MSQRTYRHPRTAERSGHKGTCRYTGSGSESCHCEFESPIDIREAMTRLGWTAIDDHDMGECFYQRGFGPHIVTIAHVMSGWSMRWEKGPGYTVIEECGFGTIQACMNFFWGTIAERFDEDTRVYWEHSAMRSQLEKVGIEPRELGKPPTQKTAVKNPLKHEVTKIMDGVKVT